MWYSQQRPKSASDCDVHGEKAELAVEDHHEMPSRMLADLKERPTPWSLYILPFSAMTLIYTGISCLPPPHQLPASMSSLIQVTVTNVITSEVAEVKLGVWGWCETLGNGEYCIAGRAILGYGWREAFGRLPAIGMMGVLKELTAVWHGPTYMKLIGPITLAAFAGHMLTLYLSTCALYSQRQLAYHARKSSLAKALQNRQCYHTILGLAISGAIVSSVLSWTSFGLIMSLQDKLELVMGLQQQAPTFAGNNVVAEATLGLGGWFLLICAVTSTLPLVTIGLHFAMDLLDDDTEEIRLEDDDEAKSPLETRRLLDGLDSPVSP